MTDESNSQQFQCLEVYALFEKCCTAVPIGSLPPFCLIEGAVPLVGGGPLLAAQRSGNLGDAILKLTIPIAE